MNTPPWYQIYYSKYVESEKELLEGSREYIQKFIDLYGTENFKVPEDITPENLQEFLEIILKYYELYLFRMTALLDIGESLYIYIYRAHIIDFLDDDRRELSLSILYELNSSQMILPEDVPFLIACLNVEEEKIAETHKAIEDYFNQFDVVKRCNQEDGNRWKVLNQQRLEAIEKGQPLPIRPMGIKLDPCYKK